MFRLVCLAVVLLTSCVAADPQAAEGEATVPPTTETVTITGTVTNEGVECPAVRTADDRLYTITGTDREKLRPGLRVRITGTIAEMSFCMQGTTISATRIEVLQ